jgi:hypothetical protein
MRGRIDIHNPQTGPIPADLSFQADEAIEVYISIGF